MHDTEVMKGAREGHYTFFALKDEAHKIKRERGRKLKAAVAVPTTKKKAIKNFRDHRETRAFLTWREAVDFLAQLESNNDSLRAVDWVSLPINHWAAVIISSHQKQV